MRHVDLANHRSRLGKTVQAYLRSFDRQLAIHIPGSLWMGAGDHAAMKADLEKSLKIACHSVTYQGVPVLPTKD